MNFLSIIILIIVIIFILICSIKVQIAIKYIIKGHDDKTVIILSILKGSIKYTYKPKEKAQTKNKEEEKKKSHLDGIGSKIDNLVSIYKMIVKIKVTLKDKIILRKIRFNLDFGTGDAFYTGILSGLIWALVGVVVSYISETFEVCEKKININAKFSEMTLVGNFSCIFSVKIVHIIIVMVKLLFYMLYSKFQKIHYADS